MITVIPTLIITSNNGPETINGIIKAKIILDWVIFFSFSSLIIKHLAKTYNMIISCFFSELLCISTSRDSALKLGGWIFFFFKDTSGLYLQFERDRKL